MGTASGCMQGPCHLLILLLIASLVHKARANHCAAGCGYTFTPPPGTSPADHEANAEQPCDCCFYDNAPLEAYTARDWYNRVPDNPARHEWYMDRNEFEPIVGESTLIAGVLYTLSDDILKMTVFFPPLVRRLIVLLFECALNI